MSQNVLIQLTGVKKAFFTEEVETHALSDINLSIQSGEYLSITGPSGCGKSTLLSLIGLLDICTEGQYVLSGHDISELNRSERAHVRNKEIGFIFQSFNLISDLTVAENVELPLTYRAEMSHQQRKAAVDKAMEEVNMSHRKSHYPSQLSGGQQQRVAIARAIAGSPSLILADEPTGNLDSKNAEAVMLLIDQLHQSGVTICMVTHDPRSADRAQRKIDILDGRIVADELTANDTKRSHKA